MYVTTCSEPPHLEASLPQTQSRPERLSKIAEKNFVIVTPAQPEVTPRNWANHAPLDMENVGISVLPHVTKDLI